MKVKEKKTAAQKVAEMTPQQKSNVLKVGLIADAITIVLLVVALLILFTSLQDVKAARDNYQEISDEITETNDALREEAEALKEQGIIYFPDYLSRDAALEALDEVDAASQAFFTNGIIAFGAYLVYFIVLLVVLKTKFPYYSDGAFFYLLFRKDKKAA